MKIQKIIAIGFLALYSLVLSHNFVPHHHHSLTDATVAYCHHEEDQHHRHEADHESARIEHNHQQETHIHCSFEEVTVLREKINIPELYSLTPSAEIYLPTEEKQTFTDHYILPHIPEPQCRDVQLRGPPHFS